MSRAFLFGMCLLAGCGARSALEPADGAPAAPGLGGAGTGGESVLGAGDQGGEGVGGAVGGAGEGGQPPLCIPVACDASWVTALPQVTEGNFGSVEKIAGDACGNVNVAIRTDSLAIPGGFADGNAVLRFDQTGSLVWHRRIVPYDAESPPHMAIAGTPAGEVVVATTFAGSISLAGLSASSDGPEDVVLAKLDTNGEVSWARAFSSSSTEYISALAVAPDGDILVGGRSKGSEKLIDFGGGPLEKGLFLARLSPTGEHRWSYRFAEEGSGPSVFQLAPNGDVLVMGRTGGAHQFPGGSSADVPEESLFVARLSADGVALFDKVYDAPPSGFGAPVQDNIAESLALTGDHVRFTVAWRGTVDFGDGPQEMGEPGWFGLPEVAMVELDGSGAFVSASSVIGPSDGITAVQTPSGVLLGLRDALVAVSGAAVTSNPIDDGFGEPPIARIPDGTVVSNPAWNEMELVGTMVPRSVYVARLCDGAL